MLICIINSRQKLWETATSPIDNSNENYNNAVIINCLRGKRWFVIKNNTLIQRGNWLNAAHLQYYEIIA